jgi:hypothetical protein
MKMYTGMRVYSHTFFNLRTAWRCVTNSKHQQLNPWRKNPYIHWTVGFCGPQNHSEHSSEKNKKFWNLTKTYDACFPSNDKIYTQTNKNYN